jgi:two-component system, cell cycle response regulator
MDKNLTLLVIDDDLAARTVITRLLTSEGYRVIQATNGPEGLARAIQYVPDAILLDVMMPGMDGFEVCRRLRADPKLGLVPVVMITALDDRDSRLEGISAGADDFMSKPFDSLELAARMHPIGRLNRYRRLLASQSRFEWMVGRSTEGYLVLDEKGDIRYANPQARLYLSLAPDEVLGNFSNLASKCFHCEPSDAWRNWPARVDSSIARFLVRPETEAAPSFWLQVEDIELPAGETWEQVVRLRDVTTQVVAHQSIRSFHSLVSHKLRTPLISWQGGLELLLTMVEIRGDAELTELAQMAISSAKRFEEEVVAILRFVDMEKTLKGQGRLAAAALKPMIEHLAGDLAISSLSFANQPALDEIWLPLSAQTTELILREILTNSKQYHPRNAPAVEIMISDLDQTSTQEACPMVRLKIMDDGVMLTPEQLASVWTPYYQGERWFTGQIPGLGLGLPKVAAAIWSVGGRCRLYNRSECPGVVVELDLPHMGDCGESYLESERTGLY